MFKCSLNCSWNSKNLNLLEFFCSIASYNEILILNTEWNRTMNDDIEVYQVVPDSLQRLVRFALLSI